MRVSWLVNISLFFLISSDFSLISAAYKTPLSVQNVN